MFHLSGEHPTLPRGEVLGALEAEGKNYRILEEHDCILVLETDASPNSLVARLAMTHRICSHLWTCPSIKEDILSSLSNTDLLDQLPHGKSFAIKVVRVRRSSPDLKTLELAAELAEALVSEVGFKVDLKNPEVQIFCILTGDVCVGGLMKATVKSEEFSRRLPHARKAFHPSTLHPKLARCMVNLARVPRRGVLLDPFCGVGGVLIEAGLIGVKPIGVDINPEMIGGARKNLLAEGIQDFELRVGDARELCRIEAHAIATDPPYGRQASTGGAELRGLYREALLAMAHALKPNACLCITSPLGLGVEELAEAAGFELLEHHDQRVHRSLTRRIYVFRKR
jgi:tRNA (guanine10-N2)-dimethyltransferase